ncbi:MAG: peptide ABC transporter substrate-binding protein, partial [Acidimicrobiia bacterium]|nr:peptide ABC transporter substrate-binding protein [Acidimicrobiia bacterium]
YLGHDLATVSHLAHRVGVMYLGRLCEVGDSVTVSTDPRHPYTQALFASALPYLPEEADAGQESVPVLGEVPSALNPPSGCRFHPRCPMAEERCSADEPQLVQVDEAHHAACHLLPLTVGRRS